MKRVFINPVVIGEDRADGGIRRIVEAQCKYLHEFDWVVTHDPNAADLIVNHGTLREERPGVPMIAQCHGLYWHDYVWPEWYSEANRRVLDVMIRAQAVTVPSHWVRNAVARGTLIDPVVIYHGVDLEDWGPAETYNYVLWNKARTDAVSNHRDMEEVSKLLPRVPFVSTFGQESLNTKIVGAVPYPRMKELVKHAGVYLATPRETFGIGTLEALACGVPVVGWDYGGQREILHNGVEGILVPYGDYESLASAISEVLQDRDRYSKAALDLIRSGQYDWRVQVQKYAQLFRNVVDDHTESRPRVSVVITCYNLGRFLANAVTSVTEQSTNDWECIIVDDASTDETHEVANRFVQSRPDRIKYIRCPENVGLSEARNVGWRASRGRYVGFLDADDMYDSAALERLADALDRDTSIHIASGGLDLMDEQGGSRRRNSWPPDSFDWWGQSAHLNQIPYSSLMRRAVLERSAGYRRRDWRAEDASFWLRTTSLGFRARRVTEKSTLVYRVRGHSKGGQERERYPDKDGDWTEWFPWRAGARSGEEGLTITPQTTVNTRLVPFGAQGPPPKGLPFWHVRHHESPAVSVIIPVGPGHKKYLVDVLDSLVAQTCPNWEAVVVLDDGSPEGTVIEGHPYARVFTTGGEGLGASRARNIGISKARGVFILFVDADDMIRPSTIEKMLATYISAGGGYVYCDIEAFRDFDHLGAEPGEILLAKEYDQTLFISSGYTPDRPGCNSITVLVAHEDVADIGPFNEEIPFWEDWMWMMEAAAKGVKGTRLAEPLLLYRAVSGTRRKGGYQLRDELHEYLRQRYEPYLTGDKQMCNCGGGKGGSLAMQTAQRALDDMKASMAAVSATMETEEHEVKSDIDPATIDLSKAQSIRLQYIGTRFGAVPYKGQHSLQTYYFGLEPSAQSREVDPRDVPRLLMSGDFKVILVSYRP